MSHLPINYPMQYLPLLTLEFGSIILSLNDQFTVFLSPSLIRYVKLDFVGIF
jgi:hypothetical protein